MTSIGTLVMIKGKRNRADNGMLLFTERNTCFHSSQLESAARVEVHIHIRLHPNKSPAHDIGSEVP